jgi:hypothetical protein
MLGVWPIFGVCSMCVWVECMCEFSKLQDTICYICKETVTSIAPEDGHVSPKHVELKELK